MYCTYHTQCNRSHPRDLLRGWGAKGHLRVRTRQTDRLRDRQRKRERDRVRASCDGDGTGWGGVYRYACHIWHGSEVLRLTQCLLWDMQARVLRQMLSRLVRSR